MEDMPRRPPSRARLWWLPPLVAWLLVAATAGATWAIRGPWSGLLAADPRVGSGLPALAAAPEPTPVLPAFTPAPTPLDAPALAARLDALVAGRANVGAHVIDATTSAVVYTAGGEPQAPASTLKLLTGLVALDVLGPDRTFETAVVRADATTIVLVGGGDPLLRSAAPTGSPGGASLEELAGRTADALVASGVTSVALGYDATLFTGPSWNPEWPETFQWSVAPITALTADHAMPEPGNPARHPDPSLFAAERFAGWLGARGIAVTSVAPAVAPVVVSDHAATPAGDSPARLAVVESLPVATIVEQALLTSDNDATETLAFHVALARGRPASFTEAPAVLVAELQTRGLWSEGMVLFDGNGISANNRVTPAVLAGAVLQGIEEPRLRALVSGLPVAGVTGTLDERFEQPDAVVGRGVVRAKTGTIRGVHALAGYVVSRSGHPLVFAFVLNEAPGSVEPRAWIDRASAELAAA